MEQANAPAFPIQSRSHYGPGLTKREYFAAMAMQGLLASNAELENTAAAAVLYADELLKELEK